MRQWEIDLAESLSKIDDPWLRNLVEIATRTVNEKIKDLNPSNLTAEDMEKITNQCYLDITGEHWQS